MMKQLIIQLIPGWEFLLGVLNKKKRIFMFQNAFFYHFQAEHFPFLGLQANTVAKSRSLFYTALARFLLVDSGDEEERFKAFILPLSGREQVFSFSVTLIP